MVKSSSARLSFACGRGFLVLLLSALVCPVGAGAAPSKGARHVAGAPAAETSRLLAQGAGNDCAPGEVLIGGKCRALGRKNKAGPAAGEAPEKAIGGACSPGEVLIGGACRALGSKSIVRPAPESPPAEATGAQCSPGEVLIGGACGALGGKGVVRPAPESPPAEATGAQCSSGEVLIGGACRALGGKGVARTEPKEPAPARDSRGECSPGEVLIGGGCRALGGGIARPAPQASPVEDLSRDCAKGEVLTDGICRRESRLGRSDPERQEPLFEGNQRSWNHLRSTDAQGTDTTVATLFYGVPETDDVQLSAQCSSLAGASQPRIVLSAETPRSAPGVPLPIRFAAPSFTRLFLGLPLQDGGGEGQQGGAFEAETDDPLWKAFAELGSIGYSVDDELALDLPLAGIGEPLKRFLTDCAMFSAKDPRSRIVADATELFASEDNDGPSARERFGGGSDSCTLLADRRSGSNGVPIKVTFINRSGEYRALAWLNGEGQPVDYARLEDGQSFTVDTSTAHPWMVTDGPGNCIERFMPTKREIVVARKSPGFGDE